MAIQSGASPALKLPTPFDALDKAIGRLSNTSSTVAGARRRITGEIAEKGNSTLDAATSDNSVAGIVKRSADVINAMCSDMDADLEAIYAVLP